MLNEIKIENFPGLERDKDIQIQEVQRTPSRLNQKRSSAWHNVINLSEAKDKQRTLKTLAEKY